MGIHFLPGPEPPPWYEPTLPGMGQPMIPWSLMVDAAQAQKRALSYLESKLALSEQEGAGRGPWLMMAGRGATRGTLRCFTAPGLDKLVTLTLEDGEQLDAAMLMAFGAADSALPHLVLDTARVGRDYA